MKPRALIQQHFLHCILLQKSCWTFSWSNWLLTIFLLLIQPLCKSWCEAREMNSSTHPKEFAHLAAAPTLIWDHICFSHHGDCHSIHYWRYSPTAVLCPARQPNSSSLTSGALSGKDLLKTNMKQLLEAAQQVRLFFKTKYYFVILEYIQSCKSYDFCHKCTSHKYLNFHRGYKSPFTTVTV